KSYLLQAYSEGIRAVKFNWRGDPSCYPKLADICQYAHDLGYLDVMINTNLAGNIGNIMRAAKYLTEIRVSIDTILPGKYEKMRRPAKRSLTLLNLCSLAESYGGRLVVQRRTDADCESDREFMGLINWLADRKVSLSSKPIQPRAVAGESTYASMPRRYCKQPSQRIVVGVDGKVYMCCLAYNEPSELYLGDLNRLPLKGMIGSCYRAIIIHRLMNNNFAELPTCEKCTSYSAYEVKA
ncbi:MAG: SPASM domain-containing protein, partial [Phycisphaerae bacterium]|nr:SPASM domain-containing protein [Phycisphaerae bacterium]